VLGALGHGMSSLAWILHDKGFRVDGFDVKATKSGVSEPYLNLTSQTSDLHDYDLCSYSSAFRNSTLLKAIRASKVEHRFETVLNCFEGKSLILVGGSHGKSTVTALIAHCLNLLDSEPSFYIGANFIDSGRGGKFSNSSDFAVIESDESDGSILKAIPDYLVITNIDREHLPFWKSFTALTLGFYSVSLVTKEKVFLGFWDFPNEIKSLSALQKINDQNFDLKGVRVSREGTYFTFRFNNRNFEGYIKFWGKVYAINAILCFKVLRYLGFRCETILEAISKYPGLTRRQEVFNYGSSTVILDYAHHPEEIREMIQTFASLYGKNIIIFYQPYRKQRVLTTLFSHKNLFQSYNAYCLEVQDENKVDISFSKRFARIVKADFCVDFEETLEKVLATASHIIILGAGDIYDRAKQRLVRSD